MNSPPQNPLPKLKPFAFWASAILVLFLALSFTLPNTKYFNPLSPGLIHRLVTFFHSTQLDKQAHSRTPSSLPSNCVLWMAPFLSGGGYSSEAWSYITSIHDTIKNPTFRLGIEQHGDLESVEFWEGLSKESKKLAFQLYNTQCRMNETIVVCHSEPGAWYPPLFQTMPCPPTGYDEPLFVIGRTMFETDKVNENHVKRCNRMDSVWVPTDFHVSTFIQSGVVPSKIAKIVQPVDVNFFDPSKYKALDIGSRAKLVLGSKSSLSGQKERKFVFLSIFKWEYRKGWDVLLKSYLKEFSKSDRVALHLLTNPYHSDSNFGSKILDFVKDSLFEEPVNGWAPVYVIDTHIAQVDLPRIYKAADAFVLPSRGEGWGRPLVEAMAMSLPVLAMNWSGPTEYLTMENSYPLPVDEMSEVREGPFKGHNWAEPSVEKLQVLMRHAMSNPEEAKGKGMKAREDMIRRFSPEVVADLVAGHIMKIFSRNLK
ncbi:hypothetical protein IFM89_018889 [Coptis chinensis]|uniref:Glycosyl transferase family 1 domain-containing protein n=1 Tax=Coptis chinensis TaxID=261450 RepID=A0A835LJ26_9MAGN|nr:hypothetical protein IFM89_018889 [Coptis chinensis]